MSKHTVTFNLKRELEQLRAKLSADMMAIRIIRKSIQDETYQDLAEGYPGDTRNISLQKVDMTENLLSYEIRKAFISMMRNMNEFIDRNVALIELASSGVRVPHNMTSSEAIDFAVQKLEETHDEYNQGQTEDMPTKLKRFEKLPKEINRYLTTYSRVRNLLEHRRAKNTKKTIQIPNKKLQIYVDGKPIKIPHTVSKGSKLSLGFANTTLTFKKGEYIVLNYDDLEAAQAWLSSMVPPEIEKDTVRIVKNRLTQLPNI